MVQRHAEGNLIDRVALLLLLLLLLLAGWTDSNGSAALLQAVTASF